MKGSGDRVIACELASGETQPQIFTTEARRRGGESGDRKGRVPERVSGHCISRAAKHKIARASVSAVLRNVGTILRAAFREIFDESAYERFLLRTKAPRSITSYRNFMQEREAGRNENQGAAEPICEANLGSSRCWPNSVLSWEIRRAEEPEGEEDSQAV